MNEQDRIRQVTDLEILCRRIISDRACVCNVIGHRCGTNLMLEDLERILLRPVTRTPDLFEYKYKLGDDQFGYCADTSDEWYGWIFRNQPDGGWTSWRRTGKNERESIEAMIQAVKDSV